MDDTPHQWPQGIGVVERKKAIRGAEKGQPLNCPRCNSSNTKFCYYNNYSLSQPRYFCRSCKRYWTHGGSLRDVPIGGGSRKNKRPNIIAQSGSSKKLIPMDLTPPFSSPQNPNQGHTSINGAVSQFSALPFLHENKVPNPQNPNYSQYLVKTASGNVGMNPFVSAPLSNPNLLYSYSGFPLVDGFKTNTHVDVEDHYQSNSSSIEELKEEHRANNGYWIGMMDGRSW